MAFNCAQAVAVDPEILERAHSAFGDNYSVKSRSTGSYSLARYQDEPEADYDDGATDLYRRIENKDWDGALSRLEAAPVEAKTWVFRREYGSEKTRWRLLPLHAVCIFRAPLALIEALIEVYSDGPKMKDDQGMLPVHLACRNGASKGVVLTLLSSFPESVHVRDRKARTPVDLVRSSNSANKEAVLEAIKRFQRDVADTTMVHDDAHAPPQPTSSKLGGSSAIKTVASATKKEDVTTDTVLEVDYEHRTVLFRLILKKEWKHAAVRAASYPEEASTWIVTKGFHGNLRFLPIHKACVLSPPFSLIEALLEAYPDGTNATDQDGWLPIHCACFYGASDEVVTSLLKPFPKGAQSKDDEGRLPLHYACLKGASQGVVDSLLDAFAKGSMSKDDEGRLPIHHACGKGAPEGVIDALLKVSPKGAQSKDDQGRLALHHACRKNASERVIRTLLRVYPRATQIKDDQDKLPIHYACQNSASVHVVSLLLSTYPESVNVQNGFGNTPLAEAKSTDNPKMEAVVRVLEKAKKEQDKIKVESGETAELSTKLNVLQDKVDSLERTLGKVFVMGKEMRHDLVRRGKDPGDVLEKFADRLIELSGASSGGSSGKSKDKTPLKARQATPVKGLFSGLVGGGKNGSSSKEKTSAKQ